MLSLHRMMACKQIVLMPKESLHEDDSEVVGTQHAPTPYWRREGWRLGGNVIDSQGQGWAS